MPGIDGKLLREWRRARGWDVPQLARQLRRASREPVAAHDGLVRMIRSWERGAHTLSERYELLYRALGFGDNAERGDGARTRGQARAPRQAEPPVHPRTSAPHATLGTADAPGPDPDTVEVCCRTPGGRIVFVAVPLCPLAAVGDAAVVASARPAARSRSGARVPVPEAADGHPAERFLIARRALRDNDNLFGSRDVIPLAMRQLAAMRDLSKSLRGSDGRELLLAQIEFADLLGWLYQDSCEYDAAQRWLDRALRWGRALGDDGCVAFILARKSQLACDMGDAVTAIAAGGAAMRLAGQGLTGAAAATYGAHGHALAGDAAASGRLYARARETLRGADVGVGRPAIAPARWVTFMDTAYIDVYHAHSLAVLGEHSAAAAGFQAAISALRPGFHRDRGVYLAREARARADAGEHDHAAELALRALAIGTETGSARIFAELAAMRDHRMASGESPAADVFRARLAAAWP